MNIFPAPHTRVRAFPTVPGLLFSHGRWLGFAGVFLAATLASWAGELLIDFNPSEAGRAISSTKPLATWAVTGSDGGKLFYLEAEGASGLLPVPVLSGYEGAPFQIGSSVEAQGGSVTLQASPLASGQISRVVDKGVETKLSLTLTGEDSIRYQAAILFLAHPRDAPFQLDAGHRMAYVARPRNALAISQNNAWQTRWLIMDGTGSCFISEESVPISGLSGISRISGDPTRTRWARLETKGPNLYLDAPAFDGPQPKLAGLRAAGVYATCDYIPQTGWKNHLFWLTTMGFFAGTAEDVEISVGKLTAVLQLLDAQAPQASVSSAKASPSASSSPTAEAYVPTPRRVVEPPATPRPAEIPSGDGELARKIFLGIVIALSVTLFAVLGRVALMVYSDKSRRR